MSYYDWGKIVSGLSDKELIRIINNKSSEIIEKVDATNNELIKRGIQIDNQEKLNEIMQKNEVEINENLPSLYSERAIWIATFFGGPLATGYMLYENYKNLHNLKFAKKSLISGIVSTIVLFGVLFSLPENIMDKIPNQLIPFIYTIIIYFIVQRLLGTELKKHKEDNGRFYSAWRAALIGFICSLVIIAGLIVYVFASPNNTETATFDSKKYETLMNEFDNNEKIALKVESIFESGNNAEILKQLENGTEIWNKNVIIIQQIEKLGTIPKLKSQDEILTEYCNLRIKSFELLKKKYSENSINYDKQIDSIYRRIDNEVEKLKTAVNNP